MIAVTDLPKLSTELIALTYVHLVKRYAADAWRSDQGIQLLATLWQVCADCEIDPLSDPLIRHLTRAHAEPRDQYMVKVLLAASALWERDAGFALLTALIPLRHAGRAGRAGKGAGLTSWREWRADGGLW